VECIGFGTSGADEKTHFSLPHESIVWR